MKPLFYIGVVAAMLVASTAVVMGGNIEEGLAAAASGNYLKAHDLWLVEARRGDASAQGYLGVLYAKGQGIPQDDKEAARWLRLAAEQGNATAQTNLGALYAKGRGVPQDDKEAARLFHQAAVQGDVTAQFSLGVMYDVGRGVALNAVVACAWYTLAMENGDEVARDFRVATQKTMTADEIEMSRQIAEQFRAEVGK